MPLVRRASSPADPAQEKEPTYESLLADLASEDEQVRRNAARRLGEHPEAASALCSAVATEAKESVRETIFTALIRIGTKPAAAGLVPLLESEDVALRNGAIEVLKSMPDAVGERIGEIFAGSADARIFGVEILSALAHPDSPRWLLRVIGEDRELNVCAAAADALGECGDKEAVAPLLRLLERFPNEPFLEFAVKTALARIACA